VCRLLLALRLIIYAPGSLSGCMQRYHDRLYAARSCFACCDLGLISASLLPVWTIYAFSCAGDSSRAVDRFDMPSLMA
jgi:hypothetical protein